MRPRFGWPCLLIFSALTLTGCQGEVKKITLGDTPSYKILGLLPLMHEGRIKPLDTVARAEIKQIYTRETIKLVSDDGKTVTSWSPVAAFLDWSVRPKFWNEQPIIAVEYLPLKQMILHSEVHEALDGIASKPTTSEADKASLTKLAHTEDIDARAIRDLIRDSKLPVQDGKELLKLAARIGEETKWLSPSDLENAQVMVDGKPAPLQAWFEDIARRDQESREMGMGPAKLTPIEKKGGEIGEKLARYRTIRDKEAFGPVKLLAMPSPVNRTMLDYMAGAFKKAQNEGPQALSPLEREAATSLFSYLKLLPDKDKAIPGENPEFDARYTAWLKEKSAWIPLELIRTVPLEVLAAAGFPMIQVKAFRDAFQAVEDGEMVNPGRLSTQGPLALVDSAHELGRSINSDFYPHPSWMKTETHFNEFSPFSIAPSAYFGGLLLLMFSLITRLKGTDYGQSLSVGGLSKGFYLLGLTSFATGIGLEAYGFFLRVSISGWAPVSNMYESVIWVAMVVSILGFAGEMMSRKTFSALAGTIAGLVGTYLSATVPILENQSGISHLPPVLRSNYWLTIHVLTIVSSYAAFALAWVLGLIGSTIYLTATYKRSARFLKLASPLLPGIPLLAAGVVGLLAMDGTLKLGPPLDTRLIYPFAALASIGGVMVGAAAFSILGEVVNRLIHRENPDLDLAALADVNPNATRPKSRAESMQATSALVKVIAGFIYRSMQVGILLVATGTFLGGWWADVSWGRFWGWDPKEVWALITLLVYLIPLHGRFAGWVNTFWLVMASVACFLSVMMAWYGVNFVLGVGLHSYGFSEGGSQGTVLAATVVVLGYAAGAAWRRKVCSTVSPTMA